MTSTAELEHGSQVAAASERVTAENEDPITHEISSTKVSETVTAVDDAPAKKLISSTVATPKLTLSITPVEAVRSTSPLLTPFSNAQVNPLGASNAGDKLSTPTTAANSRGASPLGRRIKRATVVNIPKIPTDAELPFLTDEEAEEILQDIKAFVENEQIYPHELASFIEPFEHDINLQTVQRAEDIIVNIPDAADWDEYLSELKELKLAEMNLNPAAKTQAHRRRESWVNNAIPADPRVVSYRLQKYLDNQASLVEEPLSPGGGVNGMNPPPSATSVAPVARPMHGRTLSVNPHAAPFIPGKKRFAPETEAIPSEHESEIDTNAFEEGEVHTNPSEEGAVAVEDRRMAAPRPRLNAGAAEFTPTFGDSDSSAFNFSVNKPGETAPYRLVAHEEESVHYSHHATDSQDRPYGDMDRYKRHRLVESPAFGNGKFVPGFPGAPLQPPADMSLDTESQSVTETETETKMQPAVIRPGRDSMATFKFPYGPQPKKIGEIKELPTPPPSTEKQNSSGPVPIFGSKSLTPSAFNPRAPAFEFSMPSKLTQRLVEAEDDDDTDDRDHFRDGPPSKRSAHGFDPEYEHLTSETDMDDTLSRFNFPHPPSTFTPGSGQHAAAQLRPASAAFGAKYLPHNGNRASLGSVFGGPEGFEQDGDVHQRVIRKGSRGTGPLAIPNAFETASASDEFVYPGAEDGEDDEDEDEEEEQDGESFDDEQEDDQDDSVSYEEGQQQVMTASRMSRSIARKVERQVAEQVQDVLDVLASGARNKEEAQLRERELRWKLVERKHQDAITKLQEAAPVQSSPIQAFRADIDQDAFLAKIADVVKQNAVAIDTVAILEAIKQRETREPANVDAIIAALQEKMPSASSPGQIDLELLSKSIVKLLQPLLSSAAVPSPIEMDALRSMVIDGIKEHVSKPIDHEAIARAASSAFSSAHLRMQSESEAQMSKTMAQLKANMVDEVLNALQESEKTATQRTGEVLGEVLRAVRSLRSEREKDLKEQIVLLRAERKELVAEVEKLHEESRVAKRGEEKAIDAITDGEKRIRLLQADLAAEKKDLADVKKNRTTLERVVFELKTKSNGTERELVQLREESKASKSREENHIKVSAELNEKINDLGLKNRGLDMELAKTRSAALDAERRVKQAVEERTVIIEREKASREREEALQERLRSMDERLRHAADAESLVKAAQLRVQTLEQETAALQKKLDEVVAEAIGRAQEIDELRAKATRAGSLAEHVEQLKEDLGAVRSRSSELDAINVQMTKQVQSQMEEIERARGEAAKTRDDHVSTQNRVEFLTMKLDNSKTLLKRQETDIEGFQRQMTEIKNEHAHTASVVKTELDALKQQNESLRVQLGKGSAESDGLRSELSRKESQLEISKQQQEAIRMDLAKKDAEVGKLHETAASVRSLQTEVEILRKQLNSKDAEMSQRERSSKSEIDTLLKQLNDKDEMMSQKDRVLESKDHALRSEVELLHKQLENKDEMLLQKDRILQEVSEQNEATMTDLHKSVDEMRGRLAGLEEEKAAIESAATAAASVIANGISPSDVNGMAFTDNSSFWGYPQQAMYGDYELKQPSAEYGWNQFYPDQVEEEEEYADGSRTPTLAQQHQRLWQQQQQQMQSNSASPSVASVQPSPAPTPRPMEPIDGDDEEGTWWTAD